MVRKALGGLLLACFLVVVTLLALEAFLRFFYPGIGALRAVITAGPGSDSRAYVLKPGAQVTFTGLHQRLAKPAEWQINKDGFRGARALAAKSGKYRIAVFGDSETFGWSVNEADTFLKRMEAIDNGVEVINFGVPGYNIENVADAMTARLPGLGADFVIYMFHKNDLDPPLTFSGGFAGSHLYLMWRKSQVRIGRVIWREDEGSSLSESRLSKLKGGIEKMIALARKEGAPLLVGLFDERYRFALPAEARRVCDPANGVSPCAAPAGSFWSGSVDLDFIRNRRERIDGHLPPIGHGEIAALLCEIISGSKDGHCVPPGWQ